ncbi:MAG: efflux RND transporter periplasmic adaptor subunit, partial [Candidatus Aminicenantes bacterium]|nr:efflux RND transporter periplasmic adaptor subunit [Candidatus Aminicenantes bacterium]
FSIANDLSKMQVECTVDEADIGKVAEGQKVRFTVDAFPEDTFNGVVKQVRYSPTISQNVVTYTTIVDVNNPGMKLRPGMTATVSIISGEAKGALRVPNAALRFTPTLPAEELAKIMKESFEGMAAKRQAEGGGSGQPSAAAAGPAGSGATLGAARPDGQAGSGRPGGMIFGQGQGARSGRQPSRVWIQDASGKLRMVFLRPGVTDNSYTEILRSDLKEGDLVIIGENGTTTASSQSGPPRGPMFIGR